MALSNTAQFDLAKMHLTPTERKVKEFRSLLKNMEARIANPSDLNAVGNMYSRLLEWSREHDLKGLDWTARHVANREVQEILELLEYDPMYPAWRRQALDEAYALLFDDIAKQGDRLAVEALPEPYIPEETGYRILNEHLVQTFGTKGQALKGSHEQNTHCYCATKKCEYQIKCGPPVYYDAAREKTVCGREIVATGMSQRQCCLDPVSAAINAVMPVGCCGRGGVSILGVLGLGGGQNPPALHEKPVWPAPPEAQGDFYRGQEPDMGPSFRNDDASMAHYQKGYDSRRSQRQSDHSASSKGTSRRHRDEYLQPSAGKVWWQ